MTSTMTTTTTLQQTTEGPGHLQARQDALQEELQAVVQQREALQKEIQSNQDILSKLFQSSPSRPQDSLEGIDQRIVKLEQERVRVSLPLSQEKMILKQIHKLQRSRGKVQEFVALEQEIQNIKTQVSNVRQQLRDCNQKLATIRVELNTVSMANKLGCKVEDLLGRSVEVSHDKLGQIIGKKGRNLQKLQNTLQVDVAKTHDDGTATKNHDAENRENGHSKNVVRMVGKLSSLDAAAMELDKIMQQVDQTLEGLKKPLIMYLTSKNITALAEIQASHPDVRIDARRNDNAVVCRGIPADIAAVHQDLKSWRIETSVMTMSAKEASLVVGKKGTTVDSIVQLHQVAIQLEKGNDDKMAGNEDAATSRVIVTGPSGHVESARREIQELLAANREDEKTIPVDKHIKNVLLLNNGKGIQALVQKVADAVDDKSAGYVAVNVASDALSVKGKARVLDLAVETVASEVRSLEQMVQTITVDPMAIPTFIGKGGKGVKELKGDKSVSIEFQRETGEIVVAGTDAEEIAHVLNKVKEFASQQIVERIQTDPPSQYKAQIGDFIRTRARQVNQLVFMKLDDGSQQIVLRGSRDKLDEAKSLIHEYLTENYREELEVSSEDMQALLTGGKNSKIVELAQEADVKLNSVRERQVIVARGEKSKVEKAIKLVKAFLYGGEGISLQKLTVDSRMLGTVIGRGGKTKIDLEKKHNISIIIHRNDDLISLRGPDANVEACHTEILKLIASARVSHQMNLSAKQLETLQKSKADRRIMQEIPVQVVIADSKLTVRGTQDDVRDAVACLEEAVGKQYKVGYFLAASMFKRVKEAWKDPASLQRIEKLSDGAKVKIDKDCISFSGKRDQVTKAKFEVSKYLEFLFGSQFAQMDVAETPLLTSIGKSGKITHIMGESGCQVLLDRDLSSILFFSPDADRVKKAYDLMRAVIDGERKLLFVMKLEKGEDWIVSTILGNKGSRIKALRKETKCKIDVHHPDIVVHADTEDLVAGAKEKIESIVDKARRECVFVDIPEGHMAAFVGRAGAHIKKFQDEHEVDVQLLKKGSSSVRITGKEEAVLTAQASIEEWIESRERKIEEDQAVATISLTKDQVPTVIGNKGSVIRSLEKEFNCKIEIDRKACIVSVSGAKRDEALGKIHKIATEDPAEVLAISTTTEAGEERQEKRQKKSPDARVVSSNEPTQKHASPITPIKEADFPSLAGKEQAAISSPSYSFSYAKALKPMETEVVEMEEESLDVADSDCIEVVSADGASVPFVGDVDEVRPSSPAATVSSVAVVTP